MAGAASSTPTPIDLTGRFDRQAVSEAAPDGLVEMAITGVIGDVAFQASDVVRVLRR